MKETDELEPQQYERIYWDEDVPVKDVRKSALRKLVYVGGGLCLVFSILAIFIKFPDEVELPFVVKSDQSEDIDFRIPFIYLKISSNREIRL